MLEDSPIRAGILMDTSESMAKNLPADRAIALKYAQRLLRQQSDQAFVMAFGYISAVTQTWTGDSNALSSGVRSVIRGQRKSSRRHSHYSTLYFKLAIPSLEQSIAQPAEISSCFSRMAKITRVTAIFDWRSTHASMRISQSTYFAPSLF
jgi:hypothetical protein